MSCVHTYSAALAVRARSRSLEDLARTARRRVERFGLEENGAGPSGGGEGERSIFKHRGQGQARWAFRAWGSGGDGIYRTHTQRAVREKGRHIRQRPKQDSCLTNSSLHCFIVPLTC